jgi:hypothetical protein
MRTCCTSSLGVSLDNDGGEVHVTLPPFVWLKRAGEYVGAGSIANVSKTRSRSDGEAVAKRHKAFKLVGITAPVSFLD